MTLDEATRQVLQRELARLAMGDREAFDAVFSLLWPLLRARARARLPPPEAEDAAQRALIRIFERASEFDPARDALAWAVTIMEWEIKTSRRTAWRSREIAGVTAADPRDDRPSAEEALLTAELAAALTSTLATLPPMDADALRRHAAEERPREARYRKRLQRARERLRAAWGRRHG